MAKLICSLAYVDAETNEAIQNELAHLKTFVADTKYLEDNINAIIESECKKIGVEVALVQAIVKQESKYKPFSMRYEKHLKNAEWYLKHIPESLRKNNKAFCSIGAAQVLYGTAVWLGFTGTPDDLKNPWLNIHYSVKYIKWLIKKYNRLDYVISAYNQGSNRKVKDSIYAIEKMIEKNPECAEKYVAELESLKKRDRNELLNFPDYVKPVLMYYKESGGKVIY